MLATIALLGTAPERPSPWVLVIALLIACVVAFGPLVVFLNFGQIRFRNRKVMKLLKRYAKWWGWVKARKYPKWMNVSYSWKGYTGNSIILKRYSRILGIRKFEGETVLTDKTSYNEVDYLKHLMEDNGVDSPEEFDLWLSQRGF